MHRLWEAGFTIEDEDFVEEDENTIHDAAHLSQETEQKTGSCDAGSSNARISIGTASHRSGGITCLNFFLQRHDPVLREFLLKKKRPSMPGAPDVSLTK